MVSPDKEVRCEKCDSKALFYYPFRGVIPKFKPELERIYPRAEFTPLSSSFDVFRNQFYVWEHGNEETITFSWNDKPWLMNMNPKIFVWEKDSTREIGYEICSDCGSAKKSTFDSKRYYYRFDIGGRELVASNRRGLISIRDFFASNQKNCHEPECDFPKVFYQHRDEIVSKLSTALEI